MKISRSRVLQQQHKALPLYHFRKYNYENYIFPNDVFSTHYTLFNLKIWRMSKSEYYFHIRTPFLPERNTFAITAIASDSLTFIYNGAEWLNFNQEVIPEEDEADDGEEIYKDHCQHSCQQDGPAILCHRTYHIQQSLLSVH